MERQRLRRNPKKLMTTCGANAAIVLATLMILASIANAQRGNANAPTKSEHYVKESFKAVAGTSIDYWIMSPAKIEEGKKYPLVLALHGRGGSTTAATRLGADALRTQFPCFVMAPASTRAGNWAVPGVVDRKDRKAMLPTALEAMDALLAKHPIDPDRVYVTGQSMGGYGTFGAIALRPDTFAAAIPVCGGWDPNDAARIKHIALWVFHGDMDKTVPIERSREMVKALKAAGGGPKYTEYKGVGHNSWAKAYASLETWKWLFGQKREK